MAVNGFGVIGKRVADVIVQQDDMTVAGVWRSSFGGVHGLEFPIRRMRR